MDWLKGNLNMHQELNQATIFFLGPPKSGRTSLQKRITASWTPIGGESYKEMSNIIDVTEFYSEYSEKKGGKTPKASKHKDSRSEMVPSRVHVTCWDFGSTAVLDGCLHVFMRPHSIIVLTIDLTSQSTILHLRNHLQKISATVGDPTLIICFTFVDTFLASSPKENIANLCEKIVSQCSAILKSQPVVCWHDNDNFDSISEKVANALAGANIKKSVPLKYFQLQALLKKVGTAKMTAQKSPIISQNELLSHGNACGLKNLNEILTCSRVLHGCGAILHFHTATLKDVIILKPLWLANFFAHLFNYPSRAQNGILDERSFQLFLSHFPAIVRPVAISLLKQFELAIPLHPKSQKAQNEPVLFVSALLPSTPPTSSLPEAPKVNKIERIIKFDYFPMNLFYLLVARVIQFSTQTLQEVSSLSVWMSGTTIHLNSKATITISKHMNVPDNFGFQRTHQLVVTVSSPDQILSQNVFVDVMAEFTSTLQGSSLNWMGYFKPTEDSNPVSLESICYFLEEGKIDVVWNGTQLNLFSIMPDFTIPSWTRNRIPYSELKMGKLLGTGGFADVHLATLNGTEVAVKKLHTNNDQIFQGNVDLKEFRSEIGLQGNLNHPSILAILGIVLRPVCIVMELCSFGNLDEFTKDLSQNMSWAFRLKVTADIAAGIKYLHDQVPPIAHLDMKGPNILLCSLDTDAPICAKIADFGTAEPIIQPLLVSKIDNPVWQAPEMLNGHPYTEKVDVYSCGVIFWELTTRQPYFGDLTFISDLARTVSSGGRPPIPRDICPSKYKLIITRCWHQDPDARPTMAWVLEMVDELKKKLPKLEGRARLYDQKIREAGDGSGSSDLKGSGKLDSDLTLSPQRPKAIPPSKKL